jgi:Protein of unknown function (DUF1573)
MNNTAVRYLAVSLLMITVIAGCSSNDPVSEDEFLDSVRQEVKDDPTKGSETGRIDPNNGSIAKIEPETNFFELGPVSNSQPTYKEMYVFNKGTAPLEITNITTTCPCTTAVMKEGDSVVEPGGEGTMIIKFDPERAAGYFSLKKLTIHSNDPRRPMSYVDVTANVDRDILYDPEDFPVKTFEEGKGGTIELRIIQNSDLPLELNNVQPATKMPFLRPALELLPESDWTTKDRREYLLTVTILSTAPSGIHRNSIQIATNVRRQRTTSKPIEFRVAGNYMFDQSEITLRSVEPGTPVTNVLTMTSKFPLTISSLKSSNDNITVQEHLAEDGLSATFDVLVPERPENRLQKGILTISFKSGDQEVTKDFNVVALLTRQ